MIPALLSGNPIGTLWRRYFLILTQTSMLQSNCRSVHIMTPKNSTADQTNGIISHELLKLESKILSKDDTIIHSGDST